MGRCNHNKRQCHKKHHNCTKFISNPQYPDGYRQNVNQKDWSVNNIYQTWNFNPRTDYTIIDEQAITCRIEFAPPGAAPDTVLPYSIITPWDANDSFKSTLEPDNSRNNQELRLYFSNTYASYNDAIDGRTGGSIKVEYVDEKTLRLIPTADGSIIDNFFRSRAGGVFNVRLQRVGLDRIALTTYMGGMDNEGNVIFKVRIIYRIPSRGIYLRMAELNEKTGKWTTFVPVTEGDNPRFQKDSDNDKMITYIIKGLKPGGLYCAVVGRTYFNLPFFENERPDLIGTQFYWERFVQQCDRDAYISKFRMPYGKNNCKDVKFIATSCNADLPVENRVFLSAAKKNYDFHICLGDIVYADACSKQDIDFEGTGITRKDLFNNLYDNLGRGIAWKLVSASTGMYATMDDHEVDNNWSTFPAQNLLPPFTQQEKDWYNADRFNPLASLWPLNDDVEDVVPFDIVKLAYDTWDSRIPHRTLKAMQDNVPHYTVNWGAMDLIVISHMPKIVGDEIIYPKVLGKYWLEEEIEYMKQELLKSTALVKVVASGQNPSLYNANIDFCLQEVAQHYEGLGATPVEAANFAEKLRKAATLNFVDAFREQVDEITQFVLDNNIKNVIFLGGGDHSGRVGYVDNVNAVLNVEASSLGSYNGRAAYIVEQSSTESDRFMITYPYTAYTEFDLKAQKKILKISYIGLDGSEDATVKIKLQ